MKLTSTTKKLFRTAKTYAPALTDAKYAAQRISRRLVNKPHDKDFRALALLKETKTEEEFVFLDVGANRGQSIESVRLYKQYQIASFEPNPVLAKKLQNRKRHDSAVSIINCALSDREGTTTLYIPCYRRYMFDGLASLIRSEAESWLNASKIFGFDESQLTILEFETSVCTLDSLEMAPDFIKIDVQGGEMFVLRGGRRTIEQQKPILLLERPSATQEGRFLQEYGYEPFHFRDDKFIAGIGPTSNSFFLAEEHRHLFPRHAFGHK